MNASREMQTEDGSKRGSETFVFIACIVTSNLKYTNN